jgi:hypothetical protein
MYIYVYKYIYMYIHMYEYMCMCEFLYTNIRHVGNKLRQYEVQIEVRAG